MSVEIPSSSGSPRWGSNTKLIVGLTVVALIVALDNQLPGYHWTDSPGVYTCICLPADRCAAYYLRPRFLARFVNLVYLTLLILLVCIIGIAGYALIQQSTALIISVEQFVTQLPTTVANLSQQEFFIGPFRLDFSRFDLQSLVQQLLGMVQPIVGQAGTLAGRFAASAASTIGWVLFILLVSYFLLAESGQLREDLVHIPIPGYDVDSRRLVREITRIWEVVPARPVVYFPADCCFILYSANDLGDAPVAGDSPAGRSGGFCAVCRPADYVDRYSGNYLFAGIQLPRPEPDELCHPGPDRLPGLKPDF